MIADKALEFESKGYTKVDVSKKASFKKISDNWQKWHLEDGSIGFNGQQPLSLSSGDLKLYSALYNLTKDLGPFLQGLGVTPCYYIDTIRKRSFTPRIIRKKFSKNCPFHQDYHWHKEAESKFSVSAWLLVDARVNGFQTLEFINNDPRKHLKCENNSTSIMNEEINNLISNHGLVRPVNKVSQIGNMILFNGTLPHRPTNDIGYRFSIDFRILSFESKLKMIRSIERKLKG